MKKIDVKSIDFKPHTIVIAMTSEPDYEMSRQMLLEPEYGRYIVLEGYHCSCYGFDETEWEAIEYSSEELRKIADAPYNANDDFWKAVKIHV